MHPTIARDRLGARRTTQEQLDYFRRLGQSARKAERPSRKPRTAPGRAR